ncbi:hypothetical protein TNCV_1718831 [Trichonephila clavipes]|nr:hypothetical protein TNCV_1718831 [Trichonephila clavipes]
MEPQGSVEHSLKSTGLDYLGHDISAPKSSGQKNAGRPPLLNKHGHLSERHFKSHIPPIPAKREPTRQCKVYSSKKDANGKKDNDEAHFWLNGYVNKQNCRIWSEVNPQVYVETPLHPEKLTVWCALWAGGILLQKR